MKRRPYTLIFYWRIRNMGRKLVAYFSAGGNTKKVAEMIAEAGNFDLYEIIPKEIYSKADLNWMRKVVAGRFLSALPDVDIIRKKEKKQ